MKARITILAVVLAAIGTATTANAQLPDPGMDIAPGRTALLITDPQNDFLSPEGVTWGVVGKSVTENNTVANIESLFKAAKAKGMPVFISPHYYYPTDHGWQFEGALEWLMHNIGMFDRKGALTMEGFEGSGADWLEISSHTSMTAKQLCPTPTKYTDRKPMTWCCSYANAVSTRSSSAVCQPISVLNHICAN